MSELIGVFLLGIALNWTVYAFSVRGRLIELAVRVAQIEKTLGTITKVTIRGDT